MKKEMVNPFETETRGSSSSRGMFPRLVRVAERVIARRREEAEDPRLHRQDEWITAELEDLEEFIRVVSHDPLAMISAEAQEELASAKERRRQLRRYLHQVTHPREQRLNALVETTRRVEYALQRASRVTNERERVRLLLSALKPLQENLYAAEQRTVNAAEIYLRESIEEPGPQVAAEPSVTESSAGGPAWLFEAYLPPASQLEFAPDDKAILARLARNDFDSTEGYHLNLAAQQLSLVSGFEALLCLPLLRGVEQYPFQIKTAAQALRSMRGRALLCDEVGLGKTIEAGLVLKEYLVRGLARKVLVLTPPALVSQWREEMHDKFGIDFVAHEDSEFRTLGAGAWERFDRVIASLHTAKAGAHSAAIHRLTYDLVIIDEAHHLKNRSTVNWKFVNGLKSKYLLLLTATPAQNNLDELFNLITLVSPGQLKTVTAFRREFVERGDPRKPKNPTKLRELLMDVMVRNSRSQVSVALPPRHAFTMRTHLSPEERALYDAVTRYVRNGFSGKSSERFMAQTLQAEAGSSAQALRATLEGMRQREASRRSELDPLRDLAASVRSSTKVEALLQLLRRRTEKVLLFTKYRETQQFLKNALQQAGIPAAVFSGDLSPSEKDEQVAAFARERQVMVSTDVGSEGRNLQFCHTLVNYDLPWNPMRIEQRVGRIHRIGQTETVEIFNFAAHETVEDYILEVLDSKINMFELVVGEVGEILGNLDEEREFEDLVLDMWIDAESNDAARQAFNQLGDQLVKARSEYLESKEYDDALFGDEFAAEE